MAAAVSGRTPGEGGRDDDGRRRRGGRDRRRRWRHHHRGWRGGRSDDRRWRRRDARERRDVPGSAWKRDDRLDAPVFPLEHRERRDGRPPRERRIEDRQAHELAERRRGEGRANLLELREEDPLGRGLVGPGRNGEDILAVRERQRVGRVLLALGNDLRRCRRLGRDGVRRLAWRRHVPGGVDRGGDRRNARPRAHERCLRERLLRRFDHSRLRERLRLRGGARARRRRDRDRLARFGLQRREGRVVGRALHFEAEARHRIDRAAAVVEQLDRETAHRARVATRTPRRLQRLLPRLGIDDERLFATGANGCDEDEPAHPENYYLLR